MKRPSESKQRRGCPTCAGLDPKSCLRCGGKTKMSQWETPQPSRYTEADADREMLGADDNFGLEDVGNK